METNSQWMIVDGYIIHNVRHHVEKQHAKHVLFTWIDRQLIETWRLTDKQHKMMTNNT
jgi:hypothetical protein